MFEFAEEVPDERLPSVVLEDVNFPCHLSYSGLKQCLSVLSLYSVFHCHELIDNDNCVTYCNYRLNH